MIDHAIYEILDGGSRRRIRLSAKADIRHELTSEEVELAYWCAEKAIELGVRGMGNAIDPYDVFLDMLCKRFDSAELVERNYTWRPRILY